LLEIVAIESEEGDGKKSLGGETCANAAMSQNFSTKMHNPWNKEMEGHNGSNKSGIQAPISPENRTATRSRRKIKKFRR